MKAQVLSISLKWCFILKDTYLCQPGDTHSLCLCVSTPKGHPFAQPKCALGGHRRSGGRQAISQRGRRLSH